MTRRAGSTFGTGRLYVASLTAHGRVRVYIGFDKVRDRHSIHAGQTMVLPLKHKHTNRDFVVYVGHRRCGAA